MSAPRPIARRRRSNAGPLVFVWSAWLALSLFGLDFVHTYGVNFPYYDEWEMVPAITGQQPITLQWLWSQHNEHRIVLPRLIYLAVTTVSGRDFRAGAFFDACMLSAAAAALIGVAHRLRGRTIYADAFFPLVMLHWGQAENLVLSFQIQFVGSSVLALVALLLVVGPGPMSFRRALALGGCTALFPLFGGNGLALAPALAVCVLLAGWDVRTARPGGIWRALGVWILALVSVALTALYFVNYERPAKHPPNDSPAAVLDAAMQFLTMGLGTAAKTIWPLTKYVLLVSLGATVVALAATAVTRGRGAPAARRLLLFLASICSLALGVAWARSALSPVAMFASRYATLAAPLACAIYLAWEVVDRPILRRFVQVALFFSATLALVPNRQQGIEEGIMYRDLRVGVVADLAAGVRLDELLRRYYPKMYYGGPDVLAERMRALHAQGIGVFKNLSE
jgi:hypothetical protein